MSILKRRVCKILKMAKLGEFTPEQINTNKHRSHSAEGFFATAGVLDGLRVSYYSFYTLTEFVKTHNRCGLPVDSKGGLIFPKDLDGADCRYFGYIRS